jgi:regulator of sirC expression with transglutaminase-like and TPR domain
MSRDMSEPDGVRADFIRMIERPEASFELARTALLVAAESEPNVDVEGELARIEAWGDELGSRLKPGWNNLQKLARLRAFLFEELHFRGDQQDYFSPSNSLLHQVLHRRLGIPISLGIVMLELGWRVGMPLEGVGFPGHFLVRLAGEPSDLLLDPYARGMSVHEEDCRRMLAESTRGKIEFDPRQLASVGKRDMIVRLLNNLKSAYVRGGHDQLALGVVDRLMLLHPTDLAELRDRGLLLFRLQHYSQALNCLQGYVDAAVDAEDRELIERHLIALRHLIASLN